MSFDIAAIPDELVRAKVVQHGACWLWTGAKDANGYGGFVRRKGMPGRKMKKTYVHRYMHTVFLGEIPVGYEVHHSCYNRWCCYPGHLSAMTHAENTSVHGQ